MPSSTFRVTEYDIPSGVFTATEYDLTLQNDLSSNYFVEFWGTRWSQYALPDDSGVRVVRDPFGTGDLTASGGTKVIRLSRDNDSTSWVGVIRVVECIGDPARSGFRLLDVLDVTLPDATDEGTQTTHATCRVPWSSDRAEVLAGYHYGGASTGAPASTDWASLGVGAYHYGSDGIALVRSTAATAYLIAATACVFVVEWGSEWTIEQISAGAAGYDMPTDDATSWTPSPLGSAANRDSTYLRGCPVAAQPLITTGWLGTHVALGDGETEDATEYAWSVGRVSTGASQVYGYRRSHPSMCSATWERFENEAGLSSAMTVPAPTVAESRGTDGAGIDYTVGARLPVVYMTARYAYASAHGRTLPLMRYTADTTLTIERLNSSVTWDGLALSVDLGGIVYGTTRTSTDDSQEHYAGLILPDSRLSLWAAESSYTEAGAEPGVPVASQDTGLVLRASGSMAAGEDLVVRAQRGGFPGPRGATSVWRYDTDDTDEWRGWDPPTAISGFQPVIVTDASGHLLSATKPTVVTLADGTVLMAFESHDTDAGGSYDYQIRVVSMDPDTGEWDEPDDSVIVWEQEAEFAVWPAPCLLVLPSGRVMLYHWVHDERSDEAQIRAWYSDDDGATWGLAQDYCLDASIEHTTYGQGAGAPGYSPGRIRAVYGAGQVLLFARLIANNSTLAYEIAYLQGASSDLGLTFSTIEIEGYGATSGPDWIDVLYAGGAFVVLFHQYMSAVGNYVKVAASRLGNAYTALSTVGSVVAWETTNSGAWCEDYDSDYTTYGTLTATLVGDAIAVYGYSANHGRGYMSISHDYGVTWSVPGTSSGGPNSGILVSSTEGMWYCLSATTYPRFPAACSSRGRVIMAASWLADTADEGEISIGAIELGGYTDVTLPGYRRFPQDTTRVGWEHTWLPWDLPGDCGWTPSGVAAAVETISDARFYLGTTATTRIYSCPTMPSTTVEQPIIALFLCRNTLGGVLTAKRCFAQVTLDDGAEGYDVSIRLTATGYRLYDETAAAAIGSDASFSASYGVAILVALGQGQVSVWHRSLTEDGTPDREWVEGPSGAVADSGGAAGASNVSFGHVSATANSTWYGVFYVDEAYSGMGLHNGLVNPTELLGRAMSFSGNMLPNGTIIQAIDGACIHGDEYEVPVEYRYPLERVLDHQPRRAWRSTSTAEQVIALRLTDQGDTSIGSDAIGVALYGTNIPHVEVEGYDDDTSAWVSLGTATAYQGMSELAYVREGDSVRPYLAVASGYEPHLSFGEVAGGYFCDVANEWSRRITYQSDGKWTDGVCRRPSLILAGVDGTEDASGADGAIIPASWAFVLHLNGARYSAFRLTIPTPSATVPTPPEAYYYIGALEVGPVVLFSEDYSWGRAIETEATVDAAETRDAQVSSVVLAPARRIVEFSWSDGVDTSAASSEDFDADPDFAYLSEDASAEPMLTRRDAPAQLEGLVRRLDGPHRPVVYLPRVAKSDGSWDLQALPRRAQHVLVRLEGSVRLEQVQGEAFDATDGEVWRVATISGREVV